MVCITQLMGLDWVQSSLPPKIALDKKKKSMIPSGN
ncbi:hypothetical protein SLEP1_g3999 [Rubroshorea leprosula]|uniref:Uncharacterized protein n=1 Tax=Rubroshorea leprosula TaxID=152421 RepID=A0AAV5HWY3_9ROSI|nr:hypothetical protein SLEP1_g3999 [Rubroshorea leprosula]